LIFIMMNAKKYESKSGAAVKRETTM